MSTDRRPPRSTRPSIGRYHVLGMLGRGGMAEVSLVVAGTHGDNRKPLVAKRVLDELASDPVMVRMFLDEARLGLRLSHPNVVQSFEMGADRDVPFLVMEYLDGQPLNRLLQLEREQPAVLPLAMKLRLVCDWLRGLQYAHELRDHDGAPLHVVHRDVSPQNLFVTYDGVAKVVDFGIAKAADRSHQTISGFGGPKGKVRYMAPEQARGARVDVRADVFAVATVLLELVNGRRPWPADLDDMVVLMALCEGRLPPVSLEPFVPPSIGSLLERGRAADPDRRFASAAAFREAIERVMSELDLTCSQDEVAGWMREHFAHERQQSFDRIRLGFAGMEAPHSASATDEPATATLPAPAGLSCTPAALVCPDELPSSPAASVSASVTRPTATTWGRWWGGAVVTAVMVAMMGAWMGRSSTGAAPVSEAQAAAVSATAAVSAVVSEPPVASVAASAVAPEAAGASGGGPAAAMSGGSLRTQAVLPARGGRARPAGSGGRAAPPIYLAPSW